MVASTIVILTLGFVILFVLLAASMVASGILWWYAGKVSRNYRTLTDNVGVVLEVVEEFTEHLIEVRQMEVYQFDDTLATLFQHARLVGENIKRLSQALEEESEILEDDEEKNNQGDQ